MKENLIAVVLLLILTAILPIAVSKCSERSFVKPTVSTSDTPEKPKDSGEILCALTAGLYKDSYSAETLKAIAILMNTNYKANPDSFKANDFLYEENASGSIKDVYGEIKKAAESAKNKTLRKNSEALFVPYSETSNGTTYKNENYRYIHSVASPWDCYQTDFDANAECVGVSLRELITFAKTAAVPKKHCCGIFPILKLLTINLHNKTQYV